MEGHKDLSNIIKKKLHVFIFFLQISLIWAKAARWRRKGCLAGSHPLVFAIQPTTGTSLKCAAEALALGRRLIFTWLHGHQHFGSLQGCSWSDASGWALVLFSIYTFCLA